MDTYWPVRNRQRDFLMGGGNVICVTPEDSTEAWRHWWYPVHKDTYDIKQDKTRQLGKKIFFGGAGEARAVPVPPAAPKKKGEGAL